MAACRETISFSDRGIGVFPVPRICVTPGVVKIGSLVRTLNRQKTYPGNNGSSDTLQRSAYLCRFLYKGRRVSNPLLSSVLATALSKRGFTPSANHCGVPVSESEFARSVDSCG